jgi:phosphoribosylformylglycinamidine cyclo-ligase
VTSRYRELGVDVKKRGTEAFLGQIETIFPRSFCPVFRDPHRRSAGIVFHTDGAGSKPVQSYLHWAETGEFEWFEGLAQDVVSMNIDDIVCVGARPVSLVDYVAINPRNLPKEGVLRALSRGFGRCLSLLKRLGLRMIFAGGETAELPDQISTLDVSGAAVGSVEIKRAVSGEKIAEGDLIVGLRSGGRAKFERRENSGIMCNGITLARHCLMKPEYERKHPQIGHGYSGRFSFDDYLDELGMTVGEAILSPSRIFAPVILEILEKCTGVTGLVHNTGGGMTKCLRLGRNITYVKDSLPEPDPIFGLIQREGRISWREMFEVFNVGIGFEILVRPEEAEKVVSIAARFGIEAAVIGRCKRSRKGNRVTIKSRFGKFEYG